MKQEYVGKLALTKEYLSWDEDLDDETFDKHADDGFDMMRELVKTKDTDVLAELLELFNKKTEWYGGVCETLQNDIETNFTVDQIIEAVSKKFDYLIENDLNRFANFSQNFFCYEMPEAFKDFRAMFNRVKPKEATKYIDAIEEWVGNYFPKEIALLREDMKNW